MSEMILDTPILGFEFTGDPLVEGNFLPLHRGLTVFYGLNGAGKTRLLRGIRAALTGVRSEVGLGLIVMAGAGDDQTRWTSRAARPHPVNVALAHAVLAARTNTFSERTGWDDLGSSPSERSMTSTDASAIISEHIAALAGDEDADLTRELLDTRLFLLMPTGTEAYPAWDAWAVADLERPAASRSRAELTLAEEQFNADAPDDFDEMMESYEELAARIGPYALLPPSALPPFARGREAVRSQRFAVYAAYETDAEFLRGLELQGSIDFGIDLLDVDANPSISTSGYLSAVTSILAAGDDIYSDNEARTFHESLRHFGRPTDVAGLMRLATMLRRDSAGPSPEVSELIERTILEIATWLSARASSILRSFLPDAPTIALSIRPAALRFEGPATRWSFGRGVNIEDLSRAEQDWAGRAINEALHQHLSELDPARKERAVLTILDEPESGLHRSAEAQVAEALVQRGRSSARYDLVATHSPELLDSSDSHIVEVQRGGGAVAGRSLVHDLGPVDRADLSRLGLHPSDLLRSTRVYLLVEGVHDELVLRAFLSERLRRARVEVIVISGAKSLKTTLESEVLYKFTKATVVALLDNVRHAEVTPIWREAQNIAATVSPQRGAEHVFTSLSRQGEMGSLRSWLANALRLGYGDRVVPYGLSAKDVLEYFPAIAFTGAPDTWDELRARRAAESGDPSDEKAGGLKEWIGQRFGADFSGSAVEVTIAGEVPRMDVPTEFLTLMDMLETLSIPSR